MFSFPILGRNTNTIDQSISVMASYFLALIVMAWRNGIIPQSSSKPIAESHLQLTSLTLHDPQQQWWCVVSLSDYQWVWNFMPSSVPTTNGVSHQTSLSQNCFGERSSFVTTRVYCPLSGHVVLDTSVGWAHSELCQQTPSSRAKQPGMQQVTPTAETHVVAQVYCT